MPACSAFRSSLRGSPSSPHSFRPRLHPTEVVLHERPGGRKRRPEAQHRAGACAPRGVGPDAVLMFDGIQYVWKSADLDYAIALAKASCPTSPTFWRSRCVPTTSTATLVLNVRRGSRWPPASIGTHAGTSSRSGSRHRQFVQSDPEWCGGISEWLEICKLAKAYPGVQCPARAPRSGSLDLRGVAVRVALPDAGVPDQVADSVPALSDAADGGRGWTSRWARSRGWGLRWTSRGWSESDAPRVCCRTVPP